MCELRMGWDKVEGLETYVYAVHHAMTKKQKKDQARFLKDEVWK
jgi:hypothetical protein